MKSLKLLNENLTNQKYFWLSWKNRNGKIWKKKKFQFSTCFTCRSESL